jgi:hypothetical protein
MAPARRAIVRVELICVIWPVGRHMQLVVKSATDHRSHIPSVFITPQLLMTELERAVGTFRDIDFI